ncbi:MAG: type IV pilus assembly protein PilM [Candidatus Omnitrophica bacterium]|nr:type IV pilus assembly protein PilM [Candidatus Omnitrophota bacterium]
MPDANPAGVIGLDMGVSVCRAVNLLMKGGGPELRSWISVPLDGGDEKAAVRKVLAHFGAADRSRPLVVSVNGKGTLVRNIEMPRMSVGDLRKAFLIEADKYFPFPKETVYTDCHILDPKGTDKKMSVLIAAVKKDLVDSRLALFKDIGAEPSVITLSGVAIANAFAAFPPAMLSQNSVAKGAVAVVDIGEVSTNLMIFTDRHLRFSRDILIGVSDIVKRVVNVAGCSPSEARSALYSATSRQEAVQKALEAVMGNLVAELRLSFDYFTTERGAPIVQLYPTGEGSVISVVESALAASFDTPSFIWNPFEKIALHGDVAKEQVEKEGRCFVVALGLALSEYDTV